jgi:hypothetical protein
MELFGFEIKRKSEEDAKNTQKSFVEKNEDDGAVSVTSSIPGGGAAISTYIDLEGSAKSEAELVQRYRSMLQHPEIETAVDDIVNEMINIGSDEVPIKCVTDDLKFSDSTKKKIREEFDTILSLLDFSNSGYEILTKWYVDGRLNYHIIIDEEKTKDGIKELRYIDPRKIRLVREYDRERLNNSDYTGYRKKIKNEYYIYTENGFNNYSKKLNNGLENNTIGGLKIAKDSIATCNSGLLNENNTLVISHLHKAFKPLNQLRKMEDASLIYRISRAPERRVFYIDVGNLPKAKAEQYLRSMMVEHKNRLVYDAETGEIKDDRRHMTMTDDFWLPRREGGRGTEITTLPGGQNLGEMEDILYFQKKLYKALKVPLTRMEPESGFALGRASEISRDEVKFSKFVTRLRSKFSTLFDNLLEKQLILKGIINENEWQTIKNIIRYDFIIDNHFQELKQSEILRERVNLLRDLDEYVGVYYSKDWVRRSVLKMNDDDIKEQAELIEKEKKEEPDDETDDDF